jgi:hypothetical protein
MRSIWGSVVEGMQAWLGLSLPCDLTSKLQLVDPSTMSRHSHVHQSRDSRAACQCITGLTLNQKSLENGREISRGVTAILMLRGLGRDMAHGVLAHECAPLTNACSACSLHSHIRCTQVHARVLVQQSLPHPPLYGRRRHMRARICSVMLLCHTSSTSPYFYASFRFYIYTGFASLSYLSRSSLQFASHRVQVSSNITHMLCSFMVSNQPQCMWRNTNPVYGGGFRAANAGLQVRSRALPAAFTHSQHAPYRSAVPACFRSF